MYIISKRVVEKMGKGGVKTNKSYKLTRTYDKTTIRRPELYRTKTTTQLAGKGRETNKLVRSKEHLIRF